MLVAGTAASVVFLADHESETPDSGGEAPDTVIEPPVIKAPVQDLTVPIPEGDTSFGPLVSGPSLRPVQADARLEGSALPTNQWWSSALTGPATGELWAMPLVVSARLGVGIDIRVPAIKASPDAIVSSADPGLTVVTDIVSTEVVDYDAFSVEIVATVASGDASRFRVAQGSPSLSIEMPPGPVVIDTHRSMSAPGLEVTTASFFLSSTDERRWRVVTDTPLNWTITGTTVVAQAERTTTITLIPEPDDHADSWDDVAASLAAGPVVATSATLRTDWQGGAVTQTLAWVRANRDTSSTMGASGLLPHQFERLTTPVSVLGTFETPRGLMRIVDADLVEWASGITGFVPGVPEVALDDDELEVISLLLAAERPPIGVGSYFGSKLLAALASDVEMGRQLGIDVADLEQRLGDEVRNALDYTGDADNRWLAFDESWGGIISQPVEFGSEDYNDHHFHYGYLIHAAAVVGAGDPDFLDSHGSMVDLLVSDVMGDPTALHMPFQRNFNPFLGHSYASGFARFADGNNQESSSEAVNAWWAVARWEIVSGQADLLDTAIGHYVIESVTAGTYWLGEGPSIRPTGYLHREAGIVWGGKIDFATWFDPRPSAAIGIQLLPVNFGSIYRTDPVSARERFETSKPDFMWPDIAAMDLALVAPDESLALLDSISTFDSGTSPAFARFWVLALQELGPPRNDIEVDGPFGAAFGADEDIVFVGVNPTDELVEVQFVRQGELLGRITVAPHGSTLLRR